MRKTASFFLIPMMVTVLSILGSCRRESSEPVGRVEAEESSVLRLSSEALELAGLKTARVESRAMSIPVKATGTIAFNQRKFVCLSSRVPGRIEEVYAFEGDRVKAGEKLVALYSDEYLAAQQELIQLIIQRQRALEAGDEEASSVTARLIHSAVQRLSLMGVAEQEIQGLKETRTLNYYLFIRAPFAGSIVAGRASVGAYVGRGSELFEVADLGTVWAVVDIFEKDLPLVRPGCRAEARVQAYPNQLFSGKLAVLGDVVNEATKTIKARVEIPNEEKKLKPGMFAEVNLVGIATTKALVVPHQAVRSIEGKTVVFVSGPGDDFEPREVKVGKILDGWAEILEGLEEGEVVATEGSFSLKAETLKKTLGGEE